MLLSEVEPCVAPAEENGEKKNNVAGEFYINDLFHIVDDKRSCIGKRGIMSCPQPDLEVSKRAIPVKHIEDKGKDQSGDMNDLYRLMSDSPKRP